MADLTAAQAAHLDRAGGKFRAMTIGTRVRDLEIMTDPASAGQFKVLAGEAITGGELLYMSGWDSTNSCFDAKLADANAGFPAQAVALADIDSAAVGYASQFGRIDATNTGAAVNTDAGAVGDAVFLSDTAGGWSLTESATMPQTIGYVAVDSATVGVVAISLGAEIADHTHATSNGMGGALTTASATNFDCGADGTAGTLDIFPTTATNSKIIFTCTDIGAASRNITITNAAQAAARTYTIPDAGASASFVMTGTSDQTLTGDLILGAATTSDADLKLFSHTAAKGSLLIAVTDNDGNDVTTLTSSGTTTAAAITVTLPSVTGTLLTTGTADQAINGDLQLGADGVAGTLTLLPLTASRGSLVIAAGTNTGDDVVTLTGPVASGAAATLTLPNATGYILGSAGNVAADVTLTGDLALGSDTVAGELTLNSITASKGSSLYKHQDDATDKVTTLQNNATTTGTECDITLPSTTGTLLGTGAGNPASDVTLGKDLILGADAVEGTLTLNPTTTNSGTFVIQATDNTGDDVVTLASPGTATGGAITVTLPSVAGTLVWAESTQKQVFPFIMRKLDGDQIPIFAGGGADGWSQETNEEIVLRWNNAAEPTKQAAVFHMPNDLDASSDVIVHVMGMTSAGNDDPLFTCNAFFSGVAGQAINADADAGGDTSEFTGGAVWQEELLTIASANVATSPSTLTLIITPKWGELGTDDFLMSAIWLEYTGTPLVT